MENNAKCDICGKEYSRCLSCQEIKKFTPWRAVTDTLPHYMIFLALSEYTRTKDKAKAKEALSKCDLTGLEDFNAPIKAAIYEVMGEPVQAQTQAVPKTIKAKNTSRTRKTKIETPVDVPAGENDDNEE